MENIRKNFLLGINKDTNKIYFGEIAIDNPHFWNSEKGNYTDINKQDFSASFDVGEAFNIEDVDLQQDCQNLWDCYSAEEKIKLLYDGDRTREDVFEDWTRYSDYKNFRDCSCTDYETTLNNGQTINFETTCGGQHDIREDKEEYDNIVFTDECAVKEILKLWDKYHLKNISGKKDVEEKINNILKKLGKYECHEYENIKNFIRENIQEV